MKLGRVNYGKIVLVVFITILIWVWADMALDKDRDFANVLIEADRSSSGDLRISIEGKPDFSIKKLTLRGPAAKLDAIDTQRREDPKFLTFYLSPENVGLSEPGSVNLLVMDFIKKQPRFRDLGVTVVGCDPPRIKIQTGRLVEKNLKVRVLHRNGTMLKPKTIEPTTVTMAVPQDWGPDKLIADVYLDDSEIEQARLTKYEAAAYVKFSENEKRKVPTPIIVTMPAAAYDLSSYRITGATIGFVLSQNLIGQYKPELTNYQELSSFTISATAEAKASYDETTYKILLYILDEDKQKTGELKREVIYNFPDSFIRDGKIRLDQPEGEARFTLKPIEDRNGAGS